VKDVLDTLERWTAEGLRVATATLVKTERSAPRQPGAVLAVSERGDVVGSLTGGCVEPELYEEARAVLAGASPCLRTYGIEDEDAFEAGLPCGGTVHVFIGLARRDLIEAIAAAVRDERPVALATTIEGPTVGAQEVIPVDGRSEPALEGDVFVLPLCRARACTSSAPSTTPPRSPASAASSATA
jgi:xanthine dehydrogenase accessory factor